MASWGAREGCDFQGGAQEPGPAWTSSSSTRLPPRRVPECSPTCCCGGSPEAHPAEGLPGRGRIAGPDSRELLARSGMWYMLEKQDRPVGGSAGAQHSTWLSLGASGPGRVCQVTRNWEGGGQGPERHSPMAAGTASRAAQPGECRGRPPFYSARLSQGGKRGAAALRPHVRSGAWSRSSRRPRRFRVCVPAVAHHLPPTFDGFPDVTNSSRSKRTRRVTAADSLLVS